LDALTLSMAGLPAVGAPGVNAWKEWHTICLADFAEVFVWADADTAGKKFARFMEKTLRARPVALPIGEDVNGWYVKHGAEGLRHLIDR
jgi:DNA primase